MTALIVSAIPYVFLVGFIAIIGTALRNVKRENKRHEMELDKHAQMAKWTEDGRVHFTRDSDMRRWDGHDRRSKEYRLVCHHQCSQRGRLVNVKYRCVGEWATLYDGPERRHE